MIVINIPKNLVWNDIVTFLRVCCDQHRCVNCGEIVGRNEDLAMAACGHVFHQDCWELHEASCKTKQIEFACPDCSQCMIFD